MPALIGGRIPKVMLYMGIVGAYMKFEEQIKSYEVYAYYSVIFVLIFGQVALKSGNSALSFLKDFTNFWPSS